MTKPLMIVWCAAFLVGCLAFLLVYSMFGWLGVVAWIVLYTFRMRIRMLIAVLVLRLAYRA